MGVRHTWSGNSSDTHTPRRPRGSERRRWGLRPEVLGELRELPTRGAEGAGHRGL